MKFKKTGIQNLEEMKKYLAKSGNRGCNYSAGNIIIWGQDLDLTYAIIRETIVFRTLTEKTAYYHIAEYNEAFGEIVQALSEDARAQKKNLVLADLSLDMEERLKECCPEHFDFEYDRDASDYVYETEALAELKGKKYHKKKNHVNRFKKEYEFSYEKITPENASECLAMAAKWREGREMNPSLEAEAKAMEMAFAHYEELGFAGGLLRVQGEVMAFTLGEQVTEDTFVTHFEKALEEIGELYAVMNQQFAQNELLGKYKYVNREEDLGLEGLRKAKTSYHPVFMVDKYKAVLKAGHAGSSIRLWRCSDLSRSA